MYENEIENVKKMVDFKNCPVKWKYYDDSDKLVVGKMKIKQIVFLLKNSLDKDKDVFAHGKW